MRLIMKWCAPVTLLCAVVAGCGSSHQDTARSAVENMRQIIQTYNSSRPHDLTSTGNICQTAYDDLGKRSSDLQTVSEPKRYKAEIIELRSVYREARAGFRLCAGSARTDSYPGMARAEQQILAADKAITRARSLEH